MKLGPTASCNGTCGPRDATPCTSQYNQRGPAVLVLFTTVPGFSSPEVHRYASPTINMFGQLAKTAEIVCPHVHRSLAAPPKVSELRPRAAFSIAIA